MNRVLSSQYRAEIAISPSRRSQSQHRAAPPISLFLDLPIPFESSLIVVAPRRSRSRLRANRDLAFAPIAISHPDRTFRLHRRTQSPDHAFDFVEIAPQDRAETAPIAPIALRSQRNGWVLMNLTRFDEFFLIGFCFCVCLLRNGIIYLFGS